MNGVIRKYRKEQEEQREIEKFGNLMRQVKESFAPDMAALATNMDVDTPVTVTQPTQTANTRSSSGDGQGI